MTNRVALAARSAPRLRFSRASLPLLALLLLAQVLSFAAHPTLAQADTAFSITGRGWGHGIGMSQWGAKGYAEHGYNYKQILAHYYQGTTVGTVPGKIVTVALDASRAVRTSWTLRAGTVNGRISVNGIVAPYDRSYKFTQNSGQIRVTDVSTGVLWRQFTSPVSVSASVSGSGRLEESYPTIAYAGAWVFSSHSAMSGGKYAYAAASASSVSVKFSGTSIDWIGSLGPSYGKADVYVDGVKRTTASMYAPQYAHQQRVWGTTGLSAGAVHTLTIKVLGTREASSTGNAVIVDAFDVGGSSADEPALVQVADPSGPFRHTYVRYRGSLAVTASGSGVTLRNKLDIESYLYGVVPRESPSSWPTESLKAQAVAARAYALTETNSELACTTASQVYNGHSRGSDRTKPTMHEAKASNAAVDATKGQVVKYGSSVVRTFFFSCSGGYTANVEDVWGSAPQPYYRGVPDPYEAEAGCPYAKSWGAPIVYTGTSLAKALGYSSPVSRLVLDIAPSAFVRSVQVVHVDGTTHTLTGDRMRSKLGLRSSKFACDNTLRVSDPNVYERYEQNDPRIAYSGSWVTGSLAAMSGGSYAYSGRAGDSFSATFFGTSISLIGSKGPSYGTAEIWLDGIQYGAFSQYAQTYDHSVLAYTAARLPLGKHVLTVKIRGARDPGSTGNAVIVDALEVGVAQPAITIPVGASTTRAEETNALMRYEGTWVRAASPAMSGGAYAYAYKAGAQLTMTFTGTSFSWVGPKGPGYGNADVYVDGVRLATVSQYAATFSSGLALFTSDDLGLGQHTVVIRVLGAHDVSSTGDVVIVDAFDLSDATRATVVTTPGPLGRVEESASTLKYRGIWITELHAGMSDGADRYATDAGATLSMRFSGSGVTWIGPVGPSYGKVEVYLDGVKRGTVSQYAPAYRYKAAVYDTGALAAGQHVFTLKVLGAKQSVSGGNVIVFDAFDVR